MMQADSAVFGILTKALQASDLRQQVYANNIANLETPGYKREDVSFEQSLQAALNQGAPSTGSDSTVSGSSYNWAAGLSVAPTIVQDNSNTVDNNGNNVDADAEMAALAQNQIKNETLIQDLQSRISRLKTAIG